jgi:hypothetical protein
MADPDYIHHNFCDVDLVNNAVVSEANAISIHSSLDSGGADWNWI